MSYNAFVTTIKDGSDLPYLGVYENQVSVHDFSELGKDVELIDFNSKARNLDLLPEFRSIRYVATDKITPELVEVLAQLPQLQVLNISNNRQEDWPSLKPLSSLKYLILYNVKKQASLEFLRGMSGLESLFLSEILQLKDISALTSTPNVREFALEGDLHGRGSVLPDISALFSLSKLEYLKFFSKKTKLNAADFKRFGKLRYLHISPFHHTFEIHAELQRYLPEECENATPHVLIDYPQDECVKCGATGLIKPIGARQRAFCPSCKSSKLEALLETYEALSGKPAKAAITHIPFLEDRVL